MYLDSHLAPARQKYEQLMADPAHVEQVLQKGAQRARSVATLFLLALRQAVGIRSLS